MALPTRRRLLVILVAAMAVPADATDDVDVTGGYALPNCEPDPRWLSSANGTAFRASLAPLLAALPSAAAPTGFASLRSGNGRAFARGFYFDESPPPHLCHECLSISVGRIGGCNGSRRTGFWNAGCHIAYADTNVSFASEDEYVSISSSFKHDGDVVKYYPEFYDVYQLVNLAQSLALRAANGSGRGSGGRMLATGTAMAQANSTVRILAQCPGYATAANCYRCLEKAARVLPERLRVWGYEHNGVQSAGIANMFGYDCYLRLEISAPILPLAMGKGAWLRRKMNDHLAVVIVVAVAIVVVIAGAAFLVLKRIRTSKAQAARHVVSASPCSS